MYGKDTKKHSRCGTKISQILCMTDCAPWSRNRKQRKPQCCTIRVAKRLPKRNIILKRPDDHFADASKMIFSRKYPRYCRKISEISKKALFTFLPLNCLFTFKSPFYLKIDFKHGSCIPIFSYSRVHLCPSSRHHRSRTSMRP